MSTARKLETLPARWDWRKYGTLADPIHKSHCSTLIGQYACTKQFQLDRQAELNDEGRKTCSGKTEVGTAAHETIARALRHDDMRRQILAGTLRVSDEGIRKVLQEEFMVAVAGRECIWYGKHEYDSTMEDVTQQVSGLLHNMHRHVAEVLLVEAGFICQLGPYWIEGHIDLVGRPKSNPSGLLEADWKTGANKPHQIELDHGYEGGFYAHAIAHGLFLPCLVLRDWWQRAIASAGDDESVPLSLWDRRALAAASDDRQAMHIALRSIARRHVVEGHELLPHVVQFGEFPDVISQVHLADYVPYKRKGSKAVTRPEDVAFWSDVTGSPVRMGEKVSYEAGLQRGGAWMDVRRTADDVPRLEALLRKLVGWVRMGKFVESIGEKCSRCTHSGLCLTSGYEATGDEARQMRADLRGLEGFGDDLSVND